MIRRGLVVGRFQPYHTGHHKGILNALRLVNELIIVVGSPMKSFEANKNPFTCGERIEMISGALKASRVFNRCYIIPVPDIDDNSMWVKRVESFCPRFHFVFTNNSLVSELFRSTGYAIEKLVSGQKDIKSDHIRYWLLNDTKIKGKVPKSVERYLTENCAGERIQRLLMEEEKT